MNIEFSDLLEKVQGHISKYYPSALTNESNHIQIRAYAKKYIYDNKYTVQGYDENKLLDELYNEMVGYSIITEYLGSENLEEININSWDDIELLFVDGTKKKCEKHFRNPQHAVDIVKKLLHYSGMIIDNTAPIAQGHLPHNTRITAIKEPIVDKNAGISVSMRLLHPQRIGRTEIISSEFATEEQMEFLEMCIRYGVSFVIAGRTSSGKTTLLNAILESIPNDKRIYTIETGARELALVKKNNNGYTINNVVHTIARPSDKSEFEISQEKLVETAMRFDPDVICVGEMRGDECNSTVEASLTGHTVVSTVHAGPGSGAHKRIALLCQRKFQLDFNISMIQAAQAFPIIVFAHKLENGKRKIMDISECTMNDKSERVYRQLFCFNVYENVVDNNGKYHINGQFEKPNKISSELQAILLRSGVPVNVLQEFL